MTVIPASPAGFLDFLRNTAGFNTTVLPDSSSWIPDAYAVALETVNLSIACASSLYYAMAVYNLATDWLINWAMDTPPQTFFTALRDQYKITAFVGGVVASTGDESTSTSLSTPPNLTKLSISDLQNLKTPFGRQYLAIAQRYGTGAWGVS